MPERMLTEFEGYQLLESWGVPVPPHTLVSSAMEAREAAGRIGYPVVMKIISPQIVHKSDVGGVITGIETPEAAEEAFRTIAKTAPQMLPEAAITASLWRDRCPAGWRC